MASKFLQNPNIEAAPLNEEAILLDPTTSKFFLLNRTSSFIWQRLANPCSVHALASAMCESFQGVTHDDALKDAQRSLEEFRAMSLIIEAD
jgi:Coenzyme PQQ synthesis protein D (PqqD)